MAIVIGSLTFVSGFIQTKIKCTQPHSCFLNPFLSLPGVCQHVEPLEDCLRLKLIPVLTGKEDHPIRMLLSLPARLCSMGIVNQLRKLQNSTVIPFSVN